MGLTQEEIIKRAQDKRVLYIKNKICDKNGDKPYVFISYKSDDWETVLGDIVYRLVKEYGLRVYFDGSFDSHASLWINQFPANMKDHKCKGVLAFVDDLYSMSYATLLELMCSKRKLGKEREVVPINIGKITEKDGGIASADTGLGKETYEDGTKNVHAQNEKELFDLIFNELVERKILVDAKYVYGKYAREETLTKGSCSEIIVELLRHFEKNDNPYSGSNADLSGIVATIKDAFGEEVFGEPDNDDSKDDSHEEPVGSTIQGNIAESVIAEAKISEHKVIVDNNEKKTALQIKEGGSVPQQDPGVRDGFEFEGWFVNGTDEEWDFSNPIHGDVEIYAKWEEISNPGHGLNPVEKYDYTIFGKEYHAGSREQSKLMFDAFEALTSRYPEYVEQLTQRTSIARAQDVKNANTKDADPTYFRGCKAFNIGGVEYLVGTSYGYKAKISEIKEMFKICGVPLSEFVLNGEPLGLEGASSPQPPAGRCLWEYCAKDGRSKLMWNGETTGTIITVLKGSVAAKPSQNFEKTCKFAFELKAELEKKGIIQNGRFMEDYTCDKVSTMINLLYGGSVSTPREIQQKHLRKIDGQIENITNEAENVTRGIDDISDNGGNEDTVVVLNGKPLGLGEESSPQPPTGMCLWEYCAKDGRSKLMWNGETTGTIITVLKGSVAAKPSQNFEKTCKFAFELKAELEKKGIIQNGRFMEDYTCDKVSTMINLLYGGSVSTPREIQQKHLRKMDGRIEDVTNEAENNTIDDIGDNGGNEDTVVVLNGKPLGLGEESSPQPPVGRCLWEYCAKDGRSKLMWNGETTGTIITVLKGSVAAKPSQNFEKTCNSAFELKAELEKKGIIQNGRFMEDYTCDKVSTMINLLFGGSVSTPREIQRKHLRKMDGQIEDVTNEAENNTRCIDDIGDNGGDEDTVVDNFKTTVMDGFEYSLWGVSRTANKMSDMMHDVFDLIAKKHPEKIPELAASDTITSVARKDDVDAKKLPPSKLNYFRASREHNVGETAYYVGTSYNRSQGIGQLERMLKICEGSADGFTITSSPERISHSGGNTGKKGIGELL